jgi:hypothetical protein
MRLRHQARDLERRMREEARERSREQRKHNYGPGSPFDPPNPPNLPGKKPQGIAPEEDEASSEAISLEGVRVISVDQSAGKVFVFLCGEGETPGISSKSKTAPRIEQKRSGDRLTIEVHLPKGWLLRRRQGANTQLRLQPGFEELCVDLSYGELEVRDVEAKKLRLDVGAGEIRTFAAGGALDAHVGAGRVQVHSHRVLARCETGTGDVTIDVATVAEGEYHGKVGMGRLQQRLPPGHDVTSRVSSGIGKGRVEYPAGSEGARIQVRLETGIGEAVVRERRVDGKEASPAPAGSPKPQRGPRAAAARRREDEEMRVLQLLEQGRITSQEAADLIAALQGSTAPLGEGIFDGPETDEPPSPPS